MNFSLNLLLLGFFKYVNFFIVSINEISGCTIPLFNIFLPVGISFFTFAQIAVLVDADHGKVQPMKFTHVSPAADVAEHQPLDFPGNGWRCGEYPLRFLGTDIMPESLLLSPQSGLI